MEPRLEQAKAGSRAVYFIDAAHFVFAPFLGVLWCFSRLFVKAPSGRQRLNLLAALNAITKELVTVSNVSHINSQSVCELLGKLAAIHLNTPITVVLDNARYQRCKLVQEHAGQLGIELLFLPSYSPKLNLIARFKKFVKKQCLYSKYHPDAASFQQAILSFIAEAPTKHNLELASLLTLKFQTFKEVPIVPQLQPSPLSPTVQEACWKTVTYGRVKYISSRSLESFPRR